VNVSTEGEICISFIFRMSINPEYGHVNGERANHGNGSAPPQRGRPGGSDRTGHSQASDRQLLPAWLLKRRRGEQALISMVAAAYLPGREARERRDDTVEEA
jgi:hypothetical protein